MEAGTQPHMSLMAALSPVCAYHPCRMAGALASVRWSSGSCEVSPGGPAGSFPGGWAAGVEQPTALAGWCGSATASSPWWVRVIGHLVWWLLGIEPIHMEDSEGIWCLYAQHEKKIHSQKERMSVVTRAEKFDAVDYYLFLSKSNFSISFLFMIAHFCQSAVKIAKFIHSYPFYSVVNSHSRVFGENPKSPSLSAETSVSGYDLLLWSTERWPRFFFHFLLTNLDLEFSKKHWTPRVTQFRIRMPW